MAYCAYYQAHLQRERCGFLVSVLRSFEHLAFDRTLDRESSRFEFFVPQDLEPHFVELMNYFVKEGVVLKYEKLPNRLSEPGESV